MTDPARGPFSGQPQPPQQPAYSYGPPTNEMGLPGMPQPSGVLPPGSVIPSAIHPGGRSMVIEDRPLYEAARVVGERSRRDWEYVTVARPVDLKEKIVEVPTVRRLQTLVPKVQVREVVKTIPKDEVEYVEQKIEIPHKKVVDKYVEVPIVSGTEVKYVPKMEIRERTVKVTKPEIKCVEKIIEVPQIKEVVRYVESDKNVETIIRYVRKKKAGAPTSEGTEVQQPAPRAAGDDVTVMRHTPAFTEVKPPLRPPQPVPGAHMMFPEITGGRPGVHTPRSFVPLAQTGGAIPGPPSPRLERTEQLFIPRVAKTVEVEKEVPITMNIPVPFMVPKPIQVPVEVPVLRFRDHFLPVPVRRHVIPRIIFTDEVYEVDCVKEKPVMVVEDYFKPVPVDVKIKLKEKDIKAQPIDPAELSQADMHAMWMRVNADLYDQYKEATGQIDMQRLHIAAHEAAAKAVDREESESEEELEETADETLTEEERERRQEEKEKKREERRQRREERARLRAATEQRRQEEKGVEHGSAESIQDPSGPPDFGPLPLHPGHPLMMTYLQSQWVQNPSTITHNMYTPEFFRFHASAVDSLLHPQPHQVNITQEQSLQLGPLPAEQMPCPWVDLSDARRRQRARPPQRPGEEAFGFAESFVTPSMNPELSQQPFPTPGASQQRRF